MGFGKISLTALLVVTFFSLTSILLTTKTQAQEVRLEALTKASGVPQCINTSFILASKNCSQPQVKKKNSEFLPTATLIPKVELKEKEEAQKEDVVVAPVALTPVHTATLSADMLFGMVNAHRASLALPAFEKEAQVCSVAEARKQGIADEIYNGLPMHSGFYNMNLPYWATENMIYQHTEQEALTWWLNSPVHRSAIEGNYKYACGVCNGEVCNMVFTSYDPKVFAQAPSIITPAPTQVVAEITKTDTKNTAALALSKVVNVPLETVKK